MNDFSLKFSARVFSKSNSSPEKQIEDYERKFQTKLPSRLRDILSYFGGSVIFDKPVLIKPLEPSGWEGDAGCIHITILFGPTTDDEGLEANALTFQDRLPENVLPFAGLDGGNLICYDKSNGQILFWDHEARPESKDLFLVAESFDDFEAALIAGEDAEMPTKVEGVVNVVLKF